MTAPFAPILRTLAALALAALVVAPALAQTPPPDDNGMLPAGGKFKECHGYVRHVSDVNIKVFYTQAIGIKKAYKIYVADPNGHGLYGFRT